MPALDYTLQSKYLTRPVVRSRNSATLVAWSASFSAEAIPSPADDPWVRQRVVAESVPITLDFVTTQTLAYFLQDPGTVSNIDQFISEDNTTDEETTLATTNDAICSAFMQRYANTTVSDQQVADWRTRNNAPAPGAKKGG